MEFLNDIKNAFLPELIIFITIILNILLAVIDGKNTLIKAKIINVLAVISALISLIFLQIEPNYYSYNNSFVSNLYTILFKALILVSFLLVILTSVKIIREKRKKSFEYFAVMQSGVLGALTLISSNDFLSAFVSIEILGLSCYFLSGFRKNHKSKEASLKYLLTGAVASSLFLFGVSYIYGISGSINFSVINDIYLNSSINLLFIVSSFFILIGLLFKMGSIPFNNWIIDVYEGSNYTICAYISLIPKIAATAFISRLFVFIFNFSPVIQLILAFFAVISIIYASIGAIHQTNIKRLYAYSSIIHSGFILLALSVVNVYSISSVIFYIITYIFMNIGIWCASAIYNNEYNTDEISDYKGLFYKNPYFSIALIIFLFSLAGIPPTSGFLAKLYIFTAIIRGDLIFILLLIFALIALVISLAVYIKVIKELFEKSQTGIYIKGKYLMQKIILYSLALITIIICIVPDIFIKISQIAAYYI